MSEPARPSIDRAVLDDLLEATGDDRAFLAELIDAFLADAPVLLAGAQAALGERSAAALVTPVHTLKSASASLGAMAVSERCRALEAAARAGSLDGASESVALLADELDRAMDELTAIRDEATT